MAAVNKPINTVAQIASQAIISNTTVAGVAFAVSPMCKEILVYTQVTIRTDGTFTPSLQGSVDGSTWITLKDGTAISSVTQNFTTWTVDKDGAIPPILRVILVSTSVTSGGTANAQVFLDRT